MTRRFVVGVVAALVSLTLVACSDSNKAATKPSGTTSSVAPRTTSTEGALIDDQPAADALLRDTQLPPGKWAPPPASATVWAISGENLLGVRECEDIGTSAQARAETRTGHAFDTWVESATGVQIHEETELFPSRHRVDAVAAALKSSRLGDCVKAALSRLAADNGAEINAIDVRRYDVGLRPADLRLTFVGGADVTMTVNRNGETTPMMLRFVCFGAGGGFACLTVTADQGQNGASNLDALDLAPTVRAAAKNLLAIFGM